MLKCVSIVYIYKVCANIYAILLEKGINLESFQYLTNEDLLKLIPDTKFGLRIKFRQKLINWRLEQVSRY